MATFAFLAAVFIALALGAVIGRYCWLMQWQDRFETRIAPRRKWLRRNRPTAGNDDDGTE